MSETVAVPVDAPIAAHEPVSELEKRNRLLAALYRFADRLCRAADLDQAYEAALDAIREALGCGRASILLADEEGAPRFVAWRGLSEAYRRAVDGHSPWPPALRDPQPIWIADVEASDEPEALKAVIRREGIRALAFIPLTSAGVLIGKFMVYYPDPHRFSAQESELAVIIARHLGFAVEQRRTEARRLQAEETLRLRERRLTAMFQQAGVGMALIGAEGQIVAANPAYARICGRPLGALVGVDCEAFTHPDDLPESRRAGKALATADGSVSFETRYVLPDGCELWVRINLTRVGDDQVLAIVEDIDARRRAEAEQTRLAEAQARTEARLREQAEEFYALADNIPTLCWMAYADGHIYWFNRRWYEYTGLSPESQLGWGWESVHDPAVLPKVLARWTHSLATGERFEMTFPLRGADGSFRPFLTRVVPIRDAEGRISRWFGTNTDVAAQARQQEHLQLLINELNHRVKNTLATVQSIAARTLRNAPTPTDALEAFEGRLMALSAAHNVLTESNWEGADLRRLLHRSLRPFAGQGGARIAADGPSAWLPQRMAISLAMVLHELATNAVKYGALSREEGRVAVRWSIDADGDARRLDLKWTERGGPETRPPSRRGFGSALIERTLRRDLGGSLELDFAPEGLTCRARFPLARTPADA